MRLRVCRTRQGLPSSYQEAQRDEGAVPLLPGLIPTVRQKVRKSLTPGNGEGQGEGRVTADGRGLQPVSWAARVGSGPAPIPAQSPAGQGGDFCSVSVIINARESCFQRPRGVMKNQFLHAVRAVSRTPAVTGDSSEVGRERDNRVSSARPRECPSEADTAPSVSPARLCGLSSLRGPPRSAGAASGTCPEVPQRDFPDDTKWAKPSRKRPSGLCRGPVPRAAPLPPSLGRHRTPPQSITPPTAACGDEGTRPGRKRNLVYGVDCRHGCRFLSDPSPAAGASHMASRTRTGSRGQDLAAGASGEVTSRERSDHEREGRGPRAG